MTRNGKPLAIAEHLAELASLHARLARVYESLAEDAGNALAYLPEQSVHRPAVRPTLQTDKTMLTQGEVADLLGYDSRTVRRLELAGAIPPAVGKGRLKRWPAKDLERWIADGGANRKGRCR